MLNVVKTLSRHVRIGVECEQFLVQGITRNWQGGEGTLTREVMSLTGQERNSVLSGALCLLLRGSNEER